MFYLYTIVLPIFILIANYFLLKIKPKRADEYVDLIFKTIPHVFGYSFLLYFLESEKHINTSWTFYSIHFFLIPITLIVLLLKIFYGVKNRRGKN